VHSAATVKFNEKLKSGFELVCSPHPSRLTVDINVKSLRDLMEICEGFTKLEAFMHVSTAYSNTFETGCIEERVYPSTIATDRLISLTQSVVC
jgi:hypothetical protein